MYVAANSANNLRSNMKTIAIISQKGGAGKTTIGIHLAVAAELRGMNTALFDLDPQASASSWSDKRSKPSPAVVSAQAARLPGLLEEAAAQAADLVIIDSAPNADAASLAAARAADLILIPCRPAAFDLNAIGTTLNLAAVAGKRAYVVLNAVPPHGKVGEEARCALEKEGVEVAAALASVDSWRSLSITTTNKVAKTHSIGGISPGVECLEDRGRVGRGAHQPDQLGHPGIFQVGSSLTLDADVAKGDQPVVRQLTR